MHCLSVEKELYVTNVVSGFLFLIVPQILTFVITAFVCFARDISRLEYLLYWLLMTMGMSLFAYAGSHRDRNVDRTAFSSSGLLCHSQLFICRDPVYLSDITDRNGLRNGSPFPIQQREFSLPLYYLETNVSIHTVSGEEAAGSLIEVVGGKAVAIYALVGVLLFFVGYLIYRKNV